MRKERKDRRTKGKGRNVRENFVEVSIILLSKVDSF